MEFDLVVALAMLLGPWALGGAAGWRWGATRRGAVAALLLGVLLTAAAFAAVLRTSPSSASAACGEDECVRIFGTWWLEASLVREWPLYTMAAWLGGVAIGSLVRDRRVDLPVNAR